jgi:hypothetical protein
LFVNNSNSNKIRFESYQVPLCASDQVHDLEVVGGARGLHGQQDVEEAAGVDLAGVEGVRVVGAGVQALGDGAEELEEEGRAVEGVEVGEGELEGFGDHGVGLRVGVDLEASICNLMGICLVFMCVFFS